MIQLITSCKRCKNVISESEEKTKFGEHGVRFDRVDICASCEQDINDRWERFNKIAELLKRENAGIAEITPEHASLAGSFTVDELRNIICFMEWWSKNI